MKNSGIILSILLLASNAFSGEPVADTIALQDHVNYLCGLYPPRNIDHPLSLYHAAQYIEKELKLSSNSVETQNYSVEEGEVSNIIVSFGPETGPRIIIGAHYDVAGNQPGADDNASSVAGLLELARMLSSFLGDIKKRIDLVAYTLEEPPYFGTEKMGSFIHAQSLWDNHIEVDYMISLEMIGYYSDSSDSQSYPVPLMKYFYPQKGNFIALVSNLASRHKCGSIRDSMQNNCDINIIKVSLPSFITGIDLSDHRNYWHFGYKALMITDTAFYRNRNYHDKNDLPETLNFPKMAEVVNGVFYTITH